MKRILKAALSLTVALGIAGCASVNEKTENKNVQTQEAETVFGDTMLQALKQANYAAFSKGFSADLRKTAPEAAFKKLCGDLSSKHERLQVWKRLDILDRGGVYRTELWKVSLERKTKSGTSVIDRVFYVTSAKLDGKVEVIGFKFDTLF